jgi:hypothetical protein
MSILKPETAPGYSIPRLQNSRWEKTGMPAAQPVSGGKSQKWLVGAFYSHTPKFRTAVEWKRRMKVQSSMPYRRGQRDRCEERLMIVSGQSLRWNGASCLGAAEATTNQGSRRVASGRVRDWPDAASSLPHVRPARSKWLEVAGPQGAPAGRQTWTGQAAPMLYRLAHLPQPSVSTPGVSACCVHIRQCGTSKLTISCKTFDWPRL